MKKVSVFFIILFSLLFIFGGYYLLKTYLSGNGITAKKETEKMKESEGQYRLAYNDVKGSLVLTVHLIKGPAIFELLHAGKNKYNFYLSTPQGQLVHQITNGEGDNTFKGNFEIPETADYILKAETDGVWTFRYK